MIRTTSLGPLGLKVGAQGLGCLNLTGFHGKPSGRAAAFQTVDRALDLGVTLLDTADAYGADTDAGFGGNESLVGQAIRGRRASVVISGKFRFLERYWFPQQAVTELQGSHQVATVDSKNTVSIATVKVGDRVGSMWVINAGLEPGQRVVAVGVQKIGDGMQVKPKPFSEATETAGGK